MFILNQNQRDGWMDGGIMNKKKQNKYLILLIWNSKKQKTKLEINNTQILLFLIYKILEINQLMIILVQFLIIQILENKSCKPKKKRKYNHNLKKSLSCRQKHHHDYSIFIYIYI